MLKSGFESLKAAIISKDLGAVEGICEANPNILDRINGDEWGPVHFCAAYGSAVVMQYLLQKGADKDQKTREDWTPALLALRQNNIDCFHVLMFEGANYEAQSLYGDDVISLLCEQDEVLKNIIESDMDPTLRLEKHDGHLFLRGELTDRRIC